MAANGYIRVARKITEWGWWSDPITLKVFLWCIIKANWKPGTFKGVEIPRGSFATGRASAATECHISQQQWRTAIKRLISTNEITIKSTKRFSVITVVNYEIYQTDDERATNEPTNNLTSNQPTTNHNIKKKERKENKYIQAEELFNQLWDLYIRKEGKSQVKQNHKEELLAIGYDRMKKCIENYSRQKQGCDKKYILMGSTFFNGRYKDYLPPEEIEPVAIPIEPPAEEEMTDEEFKALVESDFGEGA